MILFSLNRKKLSRQSTVPDLDSLPFPFFSDTLNQELSDTWKHKRCSTCTFIREITFQLMSSKSASPLDVLSKLLYSAFYILSEDTDMKCPLLHESHREKTNCLSPLDDCISIYVFNPLYIFRQKLWIIFNAAYKTFKLSHVKWQLFCSPIWDWAGVSAEPELGSLKPIVWITWNLFYSHAEVITRLGVFWAGSLAQAWEWPGVLRGLLFFTSM